MKWYGIVILSITLGTVANAYLNNKFVCNKGKCYQASFFTNITVRYSSVELCRLTCGKYGNLWPVPTISTDLGDQTVEIDKDNLVIVADQVPQATRPFINKISQIFLEKLWDDCSSISSSFSPKVTISIKVSSADVELLSSTDESYKLNIRGGDSIDVEINAVTIFGARHGLETLMQLTARQRRGNSCSTRIITSASIRDKPVFKHRGALLDTSRNFLQIDDIERTLRGMASVKLNVLHWHATDSHSFPLRFNNISELARYGAYSPSEIYTESDMQHIIEYGRLRGIRVILEIDSPGHAGNGWQFQNDTNLGNLVLCINKQPWRAFCVQPPCGQMNPVNPNLYVILNRLYTEISKTFQQEYFHMGGDEVHLPCWKQDDDIKSYMKEHNIPLNDQGFMKIWLDFHMKALEAWDNAVGHKDTKIVLWSSDLTDPNGLVNNLDPKRFVIQTWASTHDTLPEDLIKKGYSVIYSTNDVWYLDHGFATYSTYHDWKTVYSYKIPENDKVLGGEIAMWGEMASSSNLDQKLWPRTAAFGERLWSSPNLNPRDALYRLMTQRERLIRLGIQVDQIIPEWCYLNEGECE